MKTLHRHSYGTVPLYKGEDGYQVLLIEMHNRVHPEHAYWTFPKGTPEKGESPGETALRETREETGLKAITLDPHFSATESYVFTDGDERIEKQVTYFLGVVEDQSIQIEPDEVRSARWVSFAEAESLLTYQGARDVFSEAVLYITNSD